MALLEIKMVDKKVKTTETKTADLNSEALQSKLVDLKKEQMNMRFQHTAGQLAKTHVIRKTRREVARVKTAISQVKK